MPKITRNFYLSLFVMVFIFCVGGFLFHESDTGSAVTALAALGIGLTMLEVLDSREQRREQSGDRST